MPIIHRLDNFTINQIAAGEVVERPSSVVKELIENSIDANATAITIELGNGGSSFIRITDNGMGMEREDALVSFEPHATSKITEASDLNNIHSLGFRGEALASISSISQMEMITRQKGALSGSHIVNHGGQIISAVETGCPEGTTIIVQNIFYNTPARLKFLKSARSETAAISELVAKLILAHPEISIKYISNDKAIYHSPGNAQLLSAIISIYGRDTRDDLIYIEKSLGEERLSISGYIGKPSLARINRNHQSFFVNGRYIKSMLLSRCVEEATKNQTMINHFPWCVLSITLPPQEVDVNVHPSKTEIRFRNEEEIYNQILEWLQVAVDEKPYIPAINTSNTPQQNQPIDEVKVEQVQLGSYNKYSSIEQPIDNYVPHMEAISKPIYIQRQDKEEEKSIPYSGMKDQDDVNTINTYDFTKMKIIGSVFSTYIMVESDAELYIIDQHAAHERLVYESIKKTIGDQTALGQQLLPPYILEVTHDEYITISDSLDTFVSIGFDMEPFGGKSFIIRGIPIVLKAANIRELFHDLLDQLEYKQGNVRVTLQEEDIIMMSCKKAVKANDKLTDEEIRSLLKDLSLHKIPFTCPHGRPILVSMNQYELEKKFKRIQ